MLLQNLGHQILQLFILIKVGMLEAVAFVVICTDLFPVYPGVAVLFGICLCRMRHTYLKYSII